MMKRHLLFVILLLLPAIACNFSAGEESDSNLPIPTSLPPAPTTVINGDDGGQPVENGATATPTSAAAQATATTASVTATPASAGPTPTLCSTQSDWPTYVVQAGDTLFSISQRAGSTVDALVAANCLSSRDYLQTGFHLWVPVDLTMSDPPPTVFPDGAGMVLYPPEACSQPPFYRDLGVSNGERWRVSPELEHLTLWNSESGNRPITLLHSLEILDVYQGPVCYTKRLDGVELDFRRWQVRSAETSILGWIDEYDPISERANIGPDVEVNLFKVYPERVKSGEPITIEWIVSGANETNIFMYHTLARFASQPVTQDPWPLPTSGILTVTAPIPLTKVQFSIGFGPEDPSHWATVQIDCRDQFFGEAIDLSACPLGPVQMTQAAYQKFEHGFMLWHQDSEFDRIWVLVDGSNNSREFVDNWAGETISYNQAPPAGLLLPGRGFGKVWVENESVRQALGWATAVENSYSMEIQKTQTSYAAYTYFFSLPDGSVIQASRSMGSASWKATSRR